MNMGHACDIPRDTGYFNTCDICGVPTDADHFDVANSFQHAPGFGNNSNKQEVELASYTLHSQYCGVLLYFAQYADTEPPPPAQQILSHTPGYEWLILCNSQPRSPYLPSSIILNPWGYTAFPVHLRLEEGCSVKLVVRKVGQPVKQLSTVGGRLMGRYWYNTNYGGTPNRL